MTRPSLAGIEQRAAAATEGPWAPWLDQDGAKHMQGRLMVGNADAVIPDGETWIEGVDVNPIAECYTPEDRAFIAHARTDLPALTAAVRDVLALHQGDWSCGNPAHTNPDVGCPDCDEQCVDCGQSWPCETVRAVTARIDTTPKENDHA